MAFTGKDGTWENEGENWQGGSFNPDGSKQSEEWKDGGQTVPPSNLPATPRRNDYRLHVEADNRQTAGRRAQEAEKYPTLDLWLAAEARGRIRAPSPRSGTSARILIRDAHGHTVMSAFVKKTEARQRRWPRLCRTCGNEFAGARLIRARRCEACLKGGAK